MKNVLYHVVARGLYDITGTPWTVSSKYICGSKESARADVKRLEEILAKEDCIYGKKIEIEATINELELI
jgi:hypothetical protein